MAFAAMKHEKVWQIFQMNAHLSRDEKIDIDFFDFLGYILVALA